MTNEDLNILKDLVKGEAANLREALREGEREALNFETFDPKHYQGCIYGQISGDCFNKRATDLIIQCCERVYNENDNPVEDLDEGYITEATLNGPPREPEFPWKTRTYFSPIEKFLFFSTPKQQQNLIKYLRKEVETLDI